MKISKDTTSWEEDAAGLRSPNTWPEVCAQKPREFLGESRAHRLRRARCMVRQCEVSFSARTQEPVRILLYFPKIKWKETASSRSEDCISPDPGGGEREAEACLEPWCPGCEAVTVAPQPIGLVSHSSVLSLCSPCSAWS